MPKQQLNFQVSGRELFESEKAAVNAFAAKYAPGAPLLSDQKAQAQMKRERTRIERDLKTKSGTK